MKKTIILVIMALFIINVFGCTNTSAKVKINKSKATIYVGNTLKLKVKGTNKYVKWSSSNKKIARVNKKGKVTGLKKGKAIIKDKVGSKKYKCKITVKGKKVTNNNSVNNNLKKIVLSIDGKNIEVDWKDNKSVDALKELIKDKPLIIKMKKYGGFEQVGSVGKTLPSSDKEITTSPGDIVLYSSDQIVVFYGSNTWDYTELGKINMSKSDLKDLLGNNNVTLKLELK